MRILLVTPQLPYPPQQGTSLRNYYIARGLSERHQVSLLSFLEAGQPPNAEATATLLTFCRSVHTVTAPSRSRLVRLQQLLTSRQPDMAHRLASRDFDLKLRELVSAQTFEVVQIEGIELARSISTVREVSPKSHILFDDHNAETALQWRAFLTDVRQPGRWPAAAYSLVQVARLRRLERWACREADWVTVVSEADRLQLQKLLPGLQVTVIPNSIDVATLREWSSDSRPGAATGGPIGASGQAKCPVYDILFTGKMDYRPNVDAALWFADEVWPHLTKERSGVTWAIVGQRPHQRLDRLRIVNNITITGHVKNIEPYLAAASIVILPFRMGSGTRLKLIEALAAGKAIVSTPLGVEGVPFIHGEHGLVAATAGEMVQAILWLLDNPTERSRLGEAARRLALDYDWRRVVPLFEEVYSSS